MNDHAVPFFTHLIELRRRLLWCLIAVLTAVLASWPFAADFLVLLVQPLVDALPVGEKHLVALSPAEKWMALLKVSTLSGLIISIPVVVYQLWKFAAPGLYRRERLATVSFVSVASLLFVLGVLLCYTKMLPLMFPYLVGNEGFVGTRGFFTDASDLVRPMIQVAEAVSFTVGMLVAFGTAFELPLLVYFLTRYGIVQLETWDKLRPYAWVGAVVAGAVLTPSDVVISQLALGIPIGILYEIGILAARLIDRSQPAVDGPS